MTYDEIRDAIRSISQSSLDAYGSYAWAAGYFGSMLTEAIYLMEGNQRAEFERRIVKAMEQTRESND